MSASSLHEETKEKQETEQSYYEYATTEGAPVVDDEDFKRREVVTVRKLDLYVTPVLMGLQLISYLDRGNIGFAATQGMVEDIGLKGAQLNICISTFYIFYILAELPGSFYVKRLQFNRVLPVVTICWGLVCMCTGFIQSFAGLLITRILLGLFEGFLFCSMTILLCNWYKREELATRIAYLFVASALSGAFGGLIAFGVLHMNGVAGYPGWRWLYILEGLITIVYGFTCFWLVPKDYQTAYFLNAEDKAVMRRRAEITEAYSGGDGQHSLKDMKLAAKDIKTWCHGIIQICVVTILYGFGTFLPIIIKYGFKYSTVQAQYLVIPVNVWGAIVYWVGAILADKYKARFLSCVIIAPFGIAGYALLLAPVSASVHYFATYLIATACYLCTGTNIAWLSGNCAPDGKRAGSVGILLTLTNLGGVVSGQIYQSKMAPHYYLGHAWSLGCLVIAWIGWWIVRALYLRREAGKDRALAEGTPVSTEDLTDRSPLFRYQF